jgi:hypothetical protein
LNDESTRHALVEEAICPAWQHVRALREKVGEALSGQPAELESAAMIAAAELLENAVKYGDGDGSTASVRLVLSLSARSVRIAVSNAASSPECVRELCSRLDEIARSRDPAALYLRRLETLLSVPGESGKLGLHRIVFECGFELRAELVDGVVTVTATRSLQ